MNLAKQHRDVEASAWANAWIAQAPRFILTLDHLTWTLSGDAQEDSVFGKLFGQLHCNPKMDMRPNRTERELIVPIKLLRAVLETVAPNIVNSGIIWVMSVRVQVSSTTITHIASWRRLCAPTTRERRVIRTEKCRLAHHRRSTVPLSSSNRQMQHNRRWPRSPRGLVRCKRL